MAELISAKDLPLSDAQEVELLCVDKGELKLRPAKGLGGGGNYIIKVPVSDFVYDDESGESSIVLSESYDNFLPVLYAGGTVSLDVTEIVKLAMDDDAAMVADLLYMCPVIGWGYIPGLGVQGNICFDNSIGTFSATNGTWTPPDE